MAFNFMFSLFASIFFIFLFRALLKFFKSNAQELPLPPGTLSGSYIGETFELYSQNPNVFFASKQKRYGSIFRSHILGCPCVMISSPEAVKFVLVTRAHLFKPAFPVSKERMLGKQAIFLSQGQYHAKLRKLVLRAFMPEAIKSMVSNIESFAKDPLQSMEGRLITIFQEMKTHSINVALLSIFGRDEVLYREDFNRVSQEGKVVSLGRKIMEKTRGYFASFILYFDKSRTHEFAQVVSNTKPITMQDENKGWVSQEGKLVSIGRRMKEKIRGYLSSLILYFDKSRTHEFAQEASITKPVTKQDENKGWFKVFLVLFLVCTTGPRGVRSEDICNPLIPGSIAMDFLLANKNLRGPSVRRQMIGTEAVAVNDNFNYPNFPRGNSPPNSPARNQANPSKRTCNPGDYCRQGKKGKN